MHIPDGMLEARTWVPAWLSSLGILSYAVNAVRKRLADGTIVLMAVLAALVFALQMLNFPVAAGTSGHFSGGALVAIVLGVWPAMLVMAAVVTVQAVFFADGGITALGANLLTMAVIAPAVGRLVYLAVVRASASRTGRLAGAFIAAWAATVAAALGTAALLWTSGRLPLLPALVAMGSWHAIIGLAEGAITVGVVGYLLAVRPDLLSLRRPPERANVQGVSLVLGGLALAAVALSAFASSRPDVLEYVYSRIGSTFRPTGWHGVLGGYSGRSLAALLALIVGVIVVVALGRTRLMRVGDGRERGEQ